MIILGVLFLIGLGVWSIMKIDQSLLDRSQGIHKPASQPTLDGWGWLDLLIAVAVAAAGIYCTLH